MNGTRSTHIDHLFACLYAAQKALDATVADAAKRGIGLKCADEIRDVWTARQAIDRWYADQEQR